MVDTIIGEEIMKNLVSIKVLLVLYVCISLFACGENPNENAGADAGGYIIDLNNDTETLVEHKNDPGRYLKVDKSIIGVQIERLQINAELEPGEEQYRSLTRFAEVTGDESINEIKATVYIEKANISGLAKVQVGLELGYQPKENKGDRMNLTVIQNIMNSVSEGFKMTGKAIGCKEGGCMVIDETTLAEENSTVGRMVETRGEPHILSISWDDDYYRFVLTFDDMTGYIDGVSLASKYKFHPENFRRARLFAKIENIKSSHDSGRVVARFGNVYVNDILYDDFSIENLNSEKWVTGEIYQ